MTIIQAFLLGIFGWLSHTHTPFFGGGLIGWYTMGRPLVSGLVIGIIMGDIPGAIILASGVQALYIGLVTPGGSISPDMGLATWISVPLGLVAKADASITVAMAAPLGILATILQQPCHACMLLVVQHQKKLVEQDKLHQATLVPIYGHIVKFLFRFIPIFVFCYFGQEMLVSVMNNAPQQLIDIMTIFGRPMPLLGFAILLKMMIKENLEFVYYLLGFALVGVFGVNIITVVVIASVFAFIEFKTARAIKRGVA